MEKYRTLYQYKNRNIFQVSINLRDNLPSLLCSRKKLLRSNPAWNHFLITSQKQMDDFMEFHFGNSDDEFEKKIYNCFNGVRQLVEASEKSRDLINNWCDNFLFSKKTVTKDSFNEQYNNFTKAVNYFRSIHEVCKLVSQTDVFRLGAIWKFGGIYFDLSSSLECNFDDEFKKNTCVFIETNKEVRTSMVYSKQKHNIFIKKLIEHVHSNCFVKKIPMQYELAGPGAWTKFFKSLSGLEAIEKYNVKIFKERWLKWWNMDAEWKKDLHTPDPKDLSKQINNHWLFEY